MLNLSIYCIKFISGPYYTNHPCAKRITGGTSTYHDSQQYLNRSHETQTFYQNAQKTKMMKFKQITTSRLCLTKPEAKSPSIRPSFQDQATPSAAGH